MQFEFASGQIQGKRAAQEDTVDVLLPSRNGEKPGELARSGVSGNLVVVVADGMGGHVGGRIASNLSSKYFLESVNHSNGDWSDRLDAALLRANDVLRSATDARPELSGMGSTLVGGVLNEHGVGWVSVGDSGLYLCRQGTLYRLNEDHSFGAYLDQQVREGLMSPETAATDRRRNQLFHALLGDPLDHYERFGGFRPLQVDDVVLLASDGLKTLHDDHIGRIIADNITRPPEDLVNALLQAVEAENRERQDNASLIVIRVKEGTAAAHAGPQDQSTTISLVSVRDEVGGQLSMVDAGEDASTVVLEPTRPGPAARAAAAAEDPAKAVTKPGPAAAARPDPAPAMVSVKPKRTMALGPIILLAVVLVLIAGGVVAWENYQDLIVRWLAWSSPRA